MHETIAVIGDGGMGTTCSVLLAENGHDVRLWSAFEDQAADIDRHRENRKFLPGRKLPERIVVTADNARALDGSTLIFSATPSEYTRRVWETIREDCPPDVPVCSITKGLEQNTLMRPTQIVQDVLGQPDRPMAVLSGPSIAPEIAEGLPASVTVASEHERIARRIQEAIARPYFRVYTTDDVVGVELAGATKNIIAICAGVLDGLEMGCNAKAALLSRGLVEIARLGEAAGARGETFFGLSGVGDLVTTCISPVGRNRSFGEAIGRGKDVRETLQASESVVEGVPTARGVQQLARNLGVEMPLTEALCKVLFEDKPPREAIGDLMTRPLKSETN
jgi:glycerol-3-phosphate dehydrogenase (NAD(P)+)